MPDRDTWRFINSFAPWLSALGTLTAVIVSLYLARRASKLDVRVSAALMNMLTPGRKLADSPEFFELRVVNHGLREVTLQGIMWSQRGWRRQMYVVLHPADAYSTKLPAKLGYGEQAHFFFSTHTFPKDAASLLATLKGAAPWSLRLRLLRVGVYATTGEQFLAFLSKRVRKWLVHQAGAVSA